MVPIYAVDAWFGLRFPEQVGLLALPDRSVSRIRWNFPLRPCSVSKSECDDGGIGVCAGHGGAAWVEARWPLLPQP